MADNDAHDDQSVRRRRADGRSRRVLLAGSHRSAGCSAATASLASLRRLRITACTDACRGGRFAVGASGTGLVLPLARYARVPHADAARMQAESAEDGAAPGAAALAAVRRHSMLPARPPARPMNPASPFRRPASDIPENPSAAHPGWGAVPVLRWAGAVAASATEPDGAHAGGPSQASAPATANTVAREHECRAQPPPVPLRRPLRRHVWLQLDTEPSEAAGAAPAHSLPVAPPLRAPSPRPPIPPPRRQPAVDTSAAAAAAASAAPQMPIAAHPGTADMDEATRCVQAIAVLLQQCMR